MENGTTIPLTQNTKQLLSELKNYPTETYEQLFIRIIKEIDDEDTNLLSQEDLTQIEKSLKQIKAGKYKTQRQMEKKYNIK